MDFTLSIWRQKDRNSKGRMQKYQIADISSDMSFFEMLDTLNEQLIQNGDTPVAYKGSGNEDGKLPVSYECDCLEGICGTCSLMINGIPHGPERGTTTCQLHMRSFKDGDHIYIEPFRSKAFPIVKDLIIDRSAFDRIMQAGGYVSINTGGTPDANSLPISKEEADLSMDAAQCIGCGACVASCKNGSAMLFVAAKVAQFSHLPQGKTERVRRARNMVEMMDKEGFGNCTNQYECEAACPKEINAQFISELNIEYLKAKIFE